MSIHDSLNAARDKLEAAMKDRRFKKANLSREEKIELQAAQAMCRGKLERCQKDFDRIIREQSRYIREGEDLGANTDIQEEMLRDAALGYLLVRDAIYALRTINNHTSISHAYEMLDLATRHMSGKKSGLPLKSILNKGVYRDLTSSAAYNDKNKQLAGFYDQLKATGDIEACLNSTAQSVNEEASSAHTASSDDSDSETKARLKRKVAQEKDHTNYVLSGNARGRGNTYDR